MVVPTVVSLTEMPIIKAKREQRIDQRLAPFAFGGEVEIDVQRLRVQRHHRKQHVVAFGDGLGQRVPEHMTD